MRFPDSANKPLQYEATAHMLAGAIAYMGYVLSPATRDGWASMMHRMAAADTLSEEDPSVFASGEALVACLDITPNDMAISAAAGLLRANSQSMRAGTIGEHLDGRRDEAVQSVGLFRSQAPELSGINGLWDEVNEMSVAGIYLDSLLDAKEDARVRVDFSARALAISSAGRLLKTVKAMDPQTRRSATRACMEHGLGAHWLKSIPRRVLT